MLFHNHFHCSLSLPLNRETLPDTAMDEAMSLHDALMRRLIARHGGYESGTEGDSFIIAFPHPAQALR